MFNRRSRFSWSLPAILSTWRSSNNQTAPRPAYGKNNTEESLPNDYKDATLKDIEVAGNKTITGIFQCINEEQPTIYEAEENDELAENKKALTNDVKPEIKNKADMCSFSKSDGDKSEIKSKVDTCLVSKSDAEKVTQTVKQKKVDGKPVKENVTTSYSIPVDYKWNDNETRKQNSLNVNNKPTADQKHMSPIYIEMDDVMYKDDESENDSESNIYSVPVDSINDNEKKSENNKHMFSFTRSKQAAKIATSLPIITDTMKSNCKPQGIANPVHSDDDTTYSAPIDDISSNTLSCESFDDRIYTSPVNSPMAMNFNPSYKHVEANDSSITEYTDPVTTLNNKDKDSRDDPFATAVASIQSTKRHKQKPVKPSPYKPKKTSTTPRQEDSPLYEEIFQTAATLPYNNGMHHNPSPVSLNKTKKTAKSQEIFSSAGLDDYTVPSTHQIKLQKNPSYGDFCDTTETSEYTYVLTNRLITPGILEDACTTYTEC